jgi:hypothetical protein
MEANNLKQKDLAPFFGSESAVSEVLLGKRELNQRLELTYAIFANVLRFDEDGQVFNAKHAEKRAAQWIRSEEWEVCFYDPPPLQDLSPDAG